MLAVDTSPRPRRRRLPSLLTLALLVAVAAGGGMLVAAKRISDSVPREPTVTVALSQPSPTVENFLLVGSDSRAGADPSSTDAGGIGTTADVQGSRSDTIMILRRDRKSGTASLLSIPRDLLVDIPGHDGKRRINSAFSDGPATLIQTIQNNFRIPIHHYIEVDFFGFKRLVEALGGVDVCFENATRDENTGLVQDPGCHLLDGVQALAYARSRHYQQYINDQWVEDGTADLGRIGRQQDFINRTLAKALVRLKGNPYAAGPLLTSMTSSLTIDANLDVIAAASSLRAAVDGGLARYSLPVVGKKVKGQAVLVLGDGAQPMLDFFSGLTAVPPSVE